MDLSGIQPLYESYVKASKSDMTKEEFDTLFLFFPSLLVIASDGVVDDEEWVYVKYLAKFMADTFKTEITPKERNQLEQDYFKELSFLLEHLEEWENRFVDRLRDFLEGQGDAKEDVLDVLYLFAEASDGQSEEETEKIEELKLRLRIEE